MSKFYPISFYIEVLFTQEMSEKNRVFERGS